MIHESSPQHNAPRDRGSPQGDSSRESTLSNIPHTPLSNLESTDIRVHVYREHVISHANYGFYEKHI